MREIGRSSFFGSVICFTLGRGVTSAIFHIEGSFCSLYFDRAPFQRKSLLAGYQAADQIYENSTSYSFFVL